MMDRNGKLVIVNPYAKKKRKRPTEMESGLSSFSSSSWSSPTRKSSARNDATGEQNPNSKTKPSGFNSNSSLSAQASALIISASDKAGMEGIDRPKIAEIILRESGNSLYMQQQRRRDEKVNEKVRQLQLRLQEASPENYRVSEELDEMLRSYQHQQAIRATCVVVDMDMFYMACELLSRPDLNKKPACVGRGMILTSNYVARRYGVRSAMAGFIGDKLVEELSKGKERLIHVPSNFALYKEKSRIVTEVIREYDPHRMKSYSLDEVYLDIGPYLALFIQHRDYTHKQIRDMLLLDGNADENGNKMNNDYTSSDAVMGFLQSQSPLVCLTAVDQVVLRLRRHVQKATGGLTCSAGVARTHTTAKIASDQNKPNGQLVVDPGSTLDFVRKLPVRKIPGIGRVTEKLLQNVCNIQTGMDLYQKRGLVNFLFQPATAKFLLKASVGCSGEGSASTFGMETEEAASSASTSSEHQKGISRERSFQPESDWAQLNIRLEEISRMLAKDMMRKSVVGHTITVKVKLDTFDVLSRSQSQKRGVYVQNPEELATIAGGLFATIRAAYQTRKESSKNSRTKFAVRLLGIRCSNLIEESSFYGKTQVGTIDKFLAASSTPVDQTEVSPPGNLATTKIVKSETGFEIMNHATDPSRKLIFNPYATKRNGGDDVVIPDTNPNNRTVTDTKLAARAAVTPNENKPQTTNGQQRHDDNNNGDENNDDVTKVYCPLCHRSFFARDNDRLNAHIDTCLNGIYGGSTVRQVVREEESRLLHDTRDSSLVVEQGAVSPRDKRQRLTDFWN